MFTGLIQTIGTVVEVRPTGGAARMTLAAPDLSGSLAPGESVAVDGCCLTVETQDDRRFTAFASPETLARTTLGKVRAGRMVNLERALALGDRLGGHLVSGHVDGVGRIDHIEQRDGGAWEVSVQVPEDLAGGVIPKGSIAIDGVSLTIARLAGACVTIAVIPETWTRTTLSRKGPGEAVNIETDMIGKYVVRYLQGLGSVKPSDPSQLTLEKMLQAGY